MFAVAFGPDCGHLASGINDNSLRLWDAATGECVWTLGGHTDRVNVMSFSPDGSWLSSGAGDDTLRLWDAATGEYVRTLEGYR